jgi:multidrug resistance efflux pump
MTENAPQPTLDDLPEPTPGYGAALLEAVHRQPRPASGFSNAGARVEPGPTRPTGVRNSMAQAPVTRPTPMPKRPKGRFLVGAFLLLICGFGATTVWNSLFRYRAYGHVTGRIVEVSAPWGGVLESVLVRESESVRQGQLLATAANPELERQVVQKVDELRIAQATLDAQVSELRLQAQFREDHLKRSLAEYYELWGDLLQEQSKLDDLTAKRQRGEGMRDVVTEEKMEELRFAESGQRSKVEKLGDAVRELKVRLEVNDSAIGDLHAQLRPHAVRIETIQNDITRLRQVANLAEIRSPVSGRVIKVHRFTGEYTDPEFPVFEILVDGSLKVVLYVSQKDTDSFQIGQVLAVDSPPLSEPAMCEVVRIGERYEPVPTSIEFHYRRDETLLPIYAQPITRSEDDATLRLGTEVRLPCETVNPFSYVRRIQELSR